MHGSSCVGSSSPCSCGLSAKLELAGAEENRSFLGTGGDIVPGASKVVTAGSGGGWVSWPVWVTFVAWVPVWLCWLWVLNNCTRVGDF